jgi:hypothetical protein
MKILRFTNRFLLVGLIFTLGLALPVSPAESLFTQAESKVYIPSVLNFSVPTPIVIDHHHTDISQIPDEWLAEARKLVVHYAHTSHGNQVLSGLTWLESRNAQYNVDIHASGSVVLPDDATALRIYDGNNYAGNTYITPDMYWETADGRNHTRQVINTGWFDFSLWTWCGQMNYYSDMQVEQYIDVMTQFEVEYPGVRFIYYTGHTDGGGPAGSTWAHNDMVRQHVSSNNKVLFDFADIEAYDPVGNYYPLVTDACEWCDNWCSSRPSSFECQALPDCDHTHGLQCTLKAQAFWWLMARLAGWDGN